MIEDKLIAEAGLTEGEAKVYLALLELGVSTVGPIIEKSKVARSFAYNILNGLINKGLASYVTRDRTKYYQAAEPSRLLDYMEKRKEALERSKSELEKLMPGLKALQTEVPRTEISVYEGFRGIQTAFEHYEDKLRKGDEYLCFGGYPTQKDQYHLYWQKHHEKRMKEGIRTRMLFDKDADDDVLKNRNSYALCDTRRLHTKLKTPAWFYIYKDTTTIFLQENPDFQNTKALGVEIVNQEIADTFRAIFEDYWKKARPYEQPKR